MSFEVLFSNYLPKIMIIYFIPSFIFCIIDEKKNVKRKASYLFFISLSCLLSFAVIINGLIPNEFGVILIIIGTIFTILYLKKEIKLNKNDKYEVESKKYFIVKICILITSMLILIISSIYLININKKVYGYYEYYGALPNGKTYTEYIKLFKNGKCEYYTYIANYDCTYSLNDTTLILFYENKGYKKGYSYSFNSKRTAIIDDDNNKIVFVKKADY